MKKIFIILLLTFPVGLFAQGYQLNLQGTRQIGKGSTGLAQPTDATALFTNPGSAAFLEQNGVTVGLTPAITKGNFTDGYSNKKYETDNPVETPFNASVIFGNPDGQWRYGLSVYTPFGSTNKWEEGSAGRFDTKEISLLSISIQPTVSYKINEKWGVGIGLTYTYGNVDIRRDENILLNNGEFMETQIKSDAHGFNVNAGVYFKPSEQVALAFSYRSPLDMKASGGKAHFNAPSYLQGAQFPEGGSTGIKATLPLPQIFSLGVTYSPNENWVFNGEAYLSDWSRYDVINIELDDEVNGRTSDQLIRHYDQGYSFRIGAEYLSGRNYELRAGLMYSVSPIHGHYTSPDVPDANRLNPAIGGSYIFSDRFRIDAALLAEFIHREAHNTITDIKGTYNYNLFFPSIGLTYNF